MSLPKSIALDFPESNILQNNPNRISWLWRNRGFQKNNILRYKQIRYLINQLKIVKKSLEE